MAVRPPITAMARGFCISAPGPRPRARGRRPRMVVRLVIRIGRKRVRSGRVLRSSPCLEVYLNSPGDTKPQALVTDVHVPLEPRARGSRE